MYGICIILNLVAYTIFTDELRIVHKILDYTNYSSYRYCYM